MKEAASASDTGGREDGPSDEATDPQQIVAALEELAESLASWCQEGRDGSLEGHETAVLERVRAVLPTLLQAVVEVATIQQTQRTREAAEPLDRAPGLLVLEADGANILFTDGWHEVKIGMVAGWDGDRLVGPSYVAAREAAAAVGPRLATEAARRGALEIDRWEGGVSGRGLAILRPAAILADGALWIWGLADEYVDQRIEVSDFYHAAEHLHAAATACFTDPAEATAWADARAGELLTLGPLPILAAFDRLTPTSPHAARVRRTERAYFASRVDPMDYPALRLDGLPIGSGAIESSADHVVQRRMKRAGMRWSDTGGDAMLALRARLRSHRSLAPDLLYRSESHPVSHSVTRSISKTPAISMAALKASSDEYARQAFLPTSRARCRGASRMEGKIVPYRPETAMAPGPPQSVDQEPSA